MDSLHPSLSQALPLKDYDAEQALQAPFRAAALGIATFYKKAAENGRKAYSLGYSSALQDVLAHLQAALDQSQSHHSEQSMASTIERVMDYIQRRQEALRAESQEPNEDENSNAPVAPPSISHRRAVTPSSSSPHTLSPTYSRAQTIECSQSSREPSSTVAQAEPCPPTTTSTPRRTSPRRTTPTPFLDASRQSSSPLPSTEPSSDPSPQPIDPCPSAAMIPSPPINLTFSSFAASPFLQHYPPPSSGPLLTNNSFTTRRHHHYHRGTGPDGTRKGGKIKERASGIDRSIGVAALGSSGLLQGYSHYASSNTSSSSTESKLLGSYGNKRRFPVDSTLSIHDSNTSSISSTPPPLRITRRTNSNRSLPTSLDPSDHPNLTHRHHDRSSSPIQIHNPDDVLMVIQGPSNEDGMERSSKRFISCKSIY